MVLSAVTLVTNTSMNVCMILYPVMEQVRLLVRYNVPTQHTPVLTIIIKITLIISMLTCNVMLLNAASINLVGRTRLRKIF